MVQITKDWYNLIYLFLVLIIKWFIQNIAYGSAYAQFHKVKETKQIVQSTRKSYKLRSQAIKEYLSGEEWQDKYQEIEYGINTRI